MEESKKIGRAGTTMAHPEEQISGEELPTTNPAASENKKISNKVKLLPLIFLIYFEVAGGPYGEEPVVQAAGPMLGILGFLIFPFVWSIPEALITAELSTTYPGNGGYVIWATRAFGPFWGSLMGSWKFLSLVINMAAFPALGIDYLKNLFPIFASGAPRLIAVIVATLVLGFVNYLGLAIVGYAAIGLGLVSLAPFIIMSLIAIPKIHPHRWISLGQKGVKKDWPLFFNTLFWNLNYFDNVSTLAGEVDKPQKTFPLGLCCAVIFTCVSYIIPLIAVTGAITVDQSLWEAGFMAQASEMIVGKWLKIWIEIGAVLSTMGLFEAQLSSSAYQLEGMANMGYLPKFFSKRAKRFNTPWVAIVFSTAIIVAVSRMQYQDIIAAANFLYSLGMILEYASFLWLRRKFPTFKRPFQVPGPWPFLVFLCLIPTGFLVFLMCIGTKLVYLMSGLMTLGAIVLYFLMKLCATKKWMKFNTTGLALAESE